MPEKLLNLRLDAEDRALLEACSAKEKLTKSDVMRRALRDYAAKLKVAVPTRKNPRRRATSG
jgi:hypothetical protein